MTYKEVFQLAQEKGCELTFISIPKMDIYEPLELIVDEKSSFLLELTLIQKWLRDEHRVHVSVFGSIRHNDWNYGVETTTPTYIKGNVTEQRTYQQALLNGIGEALKKLPQKRNKGHIVGPNEMIINRITDATR